MFRLRLKLERRRITSHRNPVMEFKIRVEEHLEALSSAGKINYTAIGTGIFFDWGEQIHTYFSFVF